MPTVSDAVFVSHAGLVDNPSITPEALAALREELKHNPSQLAAREHGLFVRPMGLVLPWNSDTMLETMDAKRVSELVAMRQVFGGMDFGLWRFSFLVFAVDREGVVYLLGEVFSQRQDLHTRAGLVRDCLLELGIDMTIPIWGDCANPQDILEISRELQKLGTPWSVTGVDMENKLRRVGAARIENLMNRGAFKVRRGLSDGQTWFLGMGASKPGVPVEGSRWLWEVNNWRYPKQDDALEKAQKDDPDDNSADGADAMAASRYGIMSWWKAAKEPEPEPLKSAWLPDVLKHEMEEGRRVKAQKPKKRERRELFDEYGGV